MTVSGSFRNSARGLFSVLFEREGNVFFFVLPYCFVNCLLFALVVGLEQTDFIHVSFSPTGHGIMTLLVSFLVISKVNLAYERFREARRSVGNAFLRLRELSQLVITLSAAAAAATASDDSEHHKRINEWKSVCIVKIIELLDCTKHVVQSPKLAGLLARNEREDFTDKANDGEDPMTLAQSLRLHLYLVNDDTFQLLERVQLISKLSEYVADYRHCLELSSTPLPFGLVQMGRAFLFLWTFTMPLVLRQGPFSDVWSAMLFLFFLTYGFIGLELVAMNLATPFGDSPNDIRVTDLRDAVLNGIERDMEDSSNSSLMTHTHRRLHFSKQKGAAATSSDLRFGAGTSESADEHDYSGYHHMHFPNM